MEERTFLTFSSVSRREQHNRLTWERGQEEGRYTLSVPSPAAVPKANWSCRLGEVTAQAHSTVAWAIAPQLVSEISPIVAFPGKLKAKSGMSRDKKMCNWRTKGVL